VQIGSGPAAVIGDENRNEPLSIHVWEGTVSRMIRQPEDLAGYNIFLISLRGLQESGGAAIKPTMKGDK